MFANAGNSTSFVKEKKKGEESPHYRLVVRARAEDASQGTEFLVEGSRNETCLKDVQSIIENVQGIKCTKNEITQYTLLLLPLLLLVIAASDAGAVGTTRVQ